MAKGKITEEDGAGKKLKPNNPSQKPTECHSRTVNLSKFAPSTDHLNVLEKGLTFIPTPKIFSVKQILDNHKKLTRTLSLKYHFRNSDKIFDPKIKNFQEKSNWTPDIEKFPENIRKTISSIDQATKNILRGQNHTMIFDEDFIRLNETQNLTKAERESIRELKLRKDIVIKPADKGGATVIVDKSAYVTEALRQLNNQNYYIKLDEPIYTQNIPKIKSILNRMHIKGAINLKQFKYLSGPESCRNRIFYLLPKIHKDRLKWPQPDMPEGRPIVSDINSESYRVSELIDYHINKLACLHPSYLKNTYDFVQVVRDKVVQEDHIIVTGDVSSLYTNMNINRTVACVKQALASSRKDYPKRPDQEIIELLELTLKNNDFEFNGQYYLQTCGTAMGKKYAPALANLYLLDFDQAAMRGLQTESGYIVPLLYKRYLDDVFFIWPGTKEELKLFEEFLGKVTAGIKITFEDDINEINFLDTVIYKKQEGEDMILKTRVYFKPTDTHQLLHTSSFHPKHTTRGILKSQLLRFKRISSSKTDYDNTCKILFKTLQNRGYTRTNLRKQQKRIWYDHKERDPEQVKNNKNKKIIPIITTYDKVGERLARKYKEILSQDNFFREFKAFTAFSNHKNLRQDLVHSKL